MKKMSMLMLAALMFLVAAPVFAQGGCVNSPENPTAVLALVGSAGGFVVALRSRLRRK